MLINILIALSCAILFAYVYTTNRIVVFKPCGKDVNKYIQFGVLFIIFFLLQVQLLTCENVIIATIIWQLFMLPMYIEFIKVIIESIKKTKAGK